MGKAYNSPNLDFSVGEVVRQICHMQSGGWGTQVLGQLRGHLMRRYDIYYTYMVEQEEGPKFFALS